MARGSAKRNFRVPDDLWNAAIDRAKQRGDNLSDILRASLIDYLRTTGPSSSSSSECVA